MKRNRIVLDFGIWDFDDITHEDITQALGVQPVKKYIKGERVNANFLPLSKNNGWRMRSPCSEQDSFETQMNAMLDFFENKKSVLKEFSNKYYCEVSCALYIYTNTDESTPWVHLNSRYNKMLKDLNIEFDLDIILLSDE